MIRRMMHLDYIIKHSDLNTEGIITAQDILALHPQHLDPEVRHIPGEGVAFFWAGYHVITVTNREGGGVVVSTVKNVFWASDATLMAEVLLTRNMNGELFLATLNLTYF